MTNQQPRLDDKKMRRWIGVAFVLVGLIVFLIGAIPSVFGLDRSPVIGFVQIAVFLFGIGLICFGGYVSLNTLWNGREKTIAAEIGVRLIGTGYVVALVSGMADIFGLGTRTMPTYIPFFGHWQARGTFAGEIVIVIGFLLFLPFWKTSKGNDDKSS
jgi:hypothetical protein